MLSRSWMRARVHSEPWSPFHGVASLGLGWPSSDSSLAPLTSRDVLPYLSPVNLFV